MLVIAMNQPYYVNIDLTNEPEKEERMLNIAHGNIHITVLRITISLINNRIVAKGIKNGASGVGSKGWGQSGRSLGVRQYTQPQS